MELSVVLPSYNELRNIKLGLLDEVYSYLKSRPNTWELILSDDGSTDGSTKLLDDFAKKHSGVRVLHNVHRGKGPTVLSGMRDAKGTYVLFSDFDQSTPISDVELLLAYAKDGYDVAIGSREGKGAAREKEPFHRHLMGRIFNLCVQLLAVRGIADTQCGFKLFTKKAFERLDKAVVIYKGEHTRRSAFMGAFDVELLFLARKMRMQIAEVPVQWKYMQTRRLDPLKDSIQMFADLIRIRTTDLLGKYKV